MCIYVHILSHVNCGQAVSRQMSACFLPALCFFLPAVCGTSAALLDVPWGSEMHQLLTPCIASVSPSTAASQKHWLWLTGKACSFPVLWGSEPSQDGEYWWATTWQASLSSARVAGLEYNAAALSYCQIAVSHLHARCSQHLHVKFFFKTTDQLKNVSKNLGEALSYNFPVFWHFILKWS